MVLHDSSPKKKKKCFIFLLPPPLIYSFVSPVAILKKKKKPKKIAPKNPGNAVQIGGCMIKLLFLVSDYFSFGDN